MGVINLGNLVSKLKNSLSGIFVKKTDKATKSAFGIVKIGDNISVSSGKISVPIGTTETPGVLQVGSGLSVTDGVISATSSGTTFDELFNDTVIAGGSVEYTLSHAYTEYKVLFFCSVQGVNVSNGVPMPVASIQTGTYNSNGIGLASLSNIRFDPEDATKFSTPSGSGSLNLRIYGLK